MMIYIEKWWFYIKQGESFARALCRFDSGIVSTFETDYSDSTFFGPESAFRVIGDAGEIQCAWKTKNEIGLQYGKEWRFHINSNKNDDFIMKRCNQGGAVMVKILICIEMFVIWNFEHLDFLPRMFDFVWKMLNFAGV